MTQHQAILNALKDGNQRYKTYKPKRPNQDEEARKAAKNGQKPIAVILSCADSRVVPELIFDAGIGELFVIRVAGNVADPASIASIEYAVAELDTRVIIVLGHESCGAVKTAIGSVESLGYNLNQLLAYIKPAIQPVEQVIKKHAQLTTRVLRQQSQIIKTAFEERVIDIVPAYYKFDGEVEFLPRLVEAADEAT